MRYRASGFVAAVVVAALVVTAIAIASGSSAHGAGAAPRRRSDLAIFSASAHAERAGGRPIPAGAVYAGTSDVDGQVNRLYAWERVAGEYCLLDLEGTEASSVVCGPRAKVEQSGLVLAEKSAEYTGTNVIGLVPNGVDKVTFTNSNGSRSEVAVADHVFDYASQGGVTKARFHMPNGVLEEKTLAR